MIGHRNCGSKFVQDISEIMNGNEKSVKSSSRFQCNDLSQTDACWSDAPTFLHELSDDVDRLLLSDYRVEFHQLVVLQHLHQVGLV